MRKAHLRLSNVRIHYAGGGTKEDAVLAPGDKEKDYPEPDMFGRMPSYALFARHVIGLDVRDADFSFDKPELRPGTQVRAVLPPVHLPKVVKASF